MKTVRLLHPEDTDGPEQRLWIDLDPDAPELWVVEAPASVVLDGAFGGEDPDLDPLPDGCRYINEAEWETFQYLVERLKELDAKFPPHLDPEL